LIIKKGWLIGSSVKSVCYASVEALSSNPSVSRKKAKQNKTMHQVLGEEDFFSPSFSGSLGDPVTKG
jgi:hypothetical protein